MMQMFNYTMDIINVITDFSDELKEKFVATTYTMKALNIYHAMDLFEEKLSRELNWQISDSTILQGDVGYLFKDNDKFYMGTDGQVYTQDLRDYFESIGKLKEEITKSVEMAARVKLEPVKLGVVK